MPVIKSAIKKLRQDKKSQKENMAFQNLVDKAVRAAKKDASKKNISAAFSLIDKSAKKHLIHKNKAARMKSALVKAPSPTTAPTKSVKSTNKTTAKALKKPTKTIKKSKTAKK